MLAHLRNAVQQQFSNLYNNIVDVSEDRKVEEFREKLYVLSEKQS